MNTQSTQGSGIVNVTDDNFEQEIAGFEGLVMVDLWAAWCGPCRMISPIVDALARDYSGRVKVGKLDADVNPRTMASFNVRSIPTILFFKNGALVDRVVGAVPRAMLEQRLQQHL